MPNEPEVPPLPNCNVPADTVLPVYVLLPESISVPVPTLESDRIPPKVLSSRTPLNVPAPDFQR